MSPTPGIERIASFEGLRQAARRAARGKLRSVEVARFLFDLEIEVLRLREELLAETWRPRGYRTFAIRDPKPRTISAAPFRDRVVHHALCAELEPRLEAVAVADSYACRKGKGTVAAVRRVQELARRWRYALALDVRHFYETVNHAVLRSRLAAVVDDAGVMRLCERIIETTPSGTPPGKGLPIGNLTSQHFANFLLGEVDRLVLAAPGVGGCCRYMDDSIVLGDSKRALWRCRDLVREHLARELRLELKDEATRLAPVTDGVPFLGFRVFPGLLRLDGRRVRRLRRHLRDVDGRLDRGEIDEETAASSAASLVGWAAQADAKRLLVTFFSGRPGVGP